MSVRNVEGEVVAMSCSARAFAAVLVSCGSDVSGAMTLSGFAYAVAALTQKLAQSMQREYSRSQCVEDYLPNLTALRDGSVS